MSKGVMATYTREAYRLILDGRPATGVTIEITKDRIPQLIRDLASLLELSKDNQVLTLFGELKLEEATEQ